MIPSFTFLRPRTVFTLAVAACLATSVFAKKKTAVIVAPAAKKDQPASSGPLNAKGASASQSATPTKGAPAKTDETFQEISFGKALVVEGKVEKPQVQFTLLKEPPPEKEIRFETSFLQNILKLDRENTFKAGERYGRD